MSGIYDATINPGSAAYLGVTGSYVKILAAPAGAVQIKLDGGEGYALLEGQGFRLPDGATWFRDVQVKNLAAIAQLVQVFIGDSRFEDTRITGNVKVIDQGADKTSSGGQFLGITQKTAPAANCSINGMFAGSKPLYVKRLLFQAGVATAVRFYTSTGVPTLNPNGGVALINKSLGGAAATAQRWTAESVIDPPTAIELPGISAIGLMRAPVNYVPVELPLTTPIKIPAGTGYFLVATTGSVELEVVMDCEE